jgi:hypothetical protein
MISPRKKPTAAHRAFQRPDAYGSLPAFITNPSDSGGKTRR